MKAIDWIKSKQVEWARSNGIDLIGSKGDKGKRAYTTKLSDNLFKPIDEEVEDAFKNGGGNELSGKMRAVHSSSALGVNIFHYWLGIGEVSTIAQACGLLNGDKSYPQHIRFEEQYPITPKFRRCPNLDVVIENSSQSQFQVYAIECKFTEAYGSRQHGGMDKKYLDLEGVWEDMPNLHSLAKSISPKDTEYHHLHPAQLVKHVLGLNKKYGKSRFRLLYLWYDSIGNEGAAHRNEIEKFKEVTKADGIHFHSLSYQELIARLADRYRVKHEKYIHYIASRYL